MRGSWFLSLWHRLFPASRPGQRPFTLTCKCGTLLQGLRQERHQIRRCPRCGQSHLVLPRGAFRPPGWEPPQPQAAAPSLAWLLVPALGLTLLTMLLVFLVIRWLSPPSNVLPPPHEASPRQEILDLMDRGRRELDQGSTHLARETLEAAIQKRDEDPKQLTEAEHRRLNQLQRQLALLTNLAPVSLLVMLDQAERSPSPAAWQARFRSEYQGRGLILDDVLRRDREQRILSRRLAELRVGQAFGRVAIEDLQLAQQLPLQEPQRWILGARLRSIERQGPTWVVHLDPDSGVLISERAPLENELPGLREDLEWPLVLSRQQGLLDTLPAQRPHR